MQQVVQSKEMIVFNYLSYLFLCLAMSCFVQASFHAEAGLVIDAGEKSFTNPLTR